jgi:hypothetical protein
MDYQNTRSTAAPATQATYHCAAGIYCLIPEKDFADSPHKCFYCQRPLHGICGVEHDNSSITYYSCCQYCDQKHFAKLPSAESAFRTPTTANSITAAVGNACSTFTPLVPQSIQMVSTTEIVSQVSNNCYIELQLPEMDAKVQLQLMKAELQLQQ